MSSGFVHLHNHTHYSLLDATATTSGLVEAAVADGHPAIALTDHGVMFGAIEFYKIAKAAGIKPIIGVEAYLANGSRHEKTAMQKDNKKKNYFHILLLAKNMTGYKNLVKLTSYAHTEGFYFKPRIDKELITKYHEGIICTSACLGSMVNSYLVNGDYGKALDEAKFFKDLFGDDFYIEIQNHDLAEDKYVLENAPRIANEIGAKLVATNDIHYIKPQDSVSHNVLLHIRDTKPGTEIDFTQLRYGKPEFYFKSAAEMKSLFKDFPEAIETTLEIADKCNVEFDLGKANMPAFPIPEESPSETLEEYLRELTYQGIERKYETVTDEIRKRADYELDVINSMGFPGYFLIVWDFIRAAKELNVSVGPGRGSAAGSLVAYALDITNIDPLEFDLLFERFLNPERVSMPDIDIDFNDEKRDVVINYVKEKYGHDAVAMIITFGKLSSRAVLTDVGRLLNVSINEVRDITKKIPVVLGKVTPLKEAVELPELSHLKKPTDKKIKDLLDYSLKLEGKFRQTGIHAAGVVIAPGPIDEYVPIYKDNRMKDATIDIATQYSMNDLEDAGLLKMDFLGLRTLSIIDNTLDMIEKNHGIRIDVDKDIDYKDKETYNTFSRGDTLAIFQFESGGMQEYLKQLKPESLEEITAMNALYRPGPMGNIPQYIDVKFGRKQVEYVHPILEKILKKTNGIIVYQEQVMQLVQIIAGFTLGQADVLRRAMGKKKQDIMDSMKPQFIEGAAKNGIDEKKALEIFDLIQKFAKYGFNKSHSVAYSYLAFQTAWLKTHYPAEFIAANMSAEVNDQAKIVALKDEARKFGITVKQPDVNESGEKFTAVGNKSIYFGLTAIRNVGIPAVKSIIHAREEKPYTGFFDFVSRVDTRLLNRRTLEALVCSGAFDKIENGKRAALFESIDNALDYAKAVQDNSHANMDSLFGETKVEIKEPFLPDIPEWDEKFILQNEKEFLNFYISGHPLNEFYVTAKSFSNLTLDNNKVEHGTPVRLCGIISDLTTKLDKKKRPLGFLIVEDFKGKTECIAWSDTFEAYGHNAIKDKVVLIQGKVDKKFEEDKLKIIIDSITPADEFEKNYAKGYMITLDSETHSTDDVKWIKNEVFNGTNSMTKLCILVKPSNKEYVAEEKPIHISNETTKKLIDKFGEKNVKYLIS